MTKGELRTRILAAREAAPDRDAKSRMIQQRLVELPEFQRSSSILTYIGVKSEVGTGAIVRDALGKGKRLAVPYVAGDTLRAAFIESTADLEPAQFGLLEPIPEVRNDPLRVCDISTVDLFVVPGVAFDRAGGRLGHGKAYYDRLLAGAKPEARFIALAFECQVVDSVPMTPTDIHMHSVVTEKRTYMRPAGALGREGRP
jgi:5-formyltetrahydrofolate cyclo-ligase